MKRINRFRSVGRIHVCLFALIVGASALFTPAAQAETAAWTLANSGQFTNNSAWNTGIAPTNAGDTANITNKTAGYTVTLYNPTPTLTNNLLVVSNTTLVITQAVMNVTNTVAGATFTGNNNLSLGTLALWSGGHLEIDNGGTLNITATNNDIYWGDPNGLLVLNSGGMLNTTGTLNGSMCASANWTNHITSTTGSGGVPGSGGTFSYGGNRTLYFGRYAPSATLIIDNGVTVSNINNLYVGGNGTNTTLWITNGAAVWLNFAQTNANGSGNAANLYIGSSAAALSNGVVVSNASLYGGNIVIANSSGSNNYLIATAGSVISNSGTINIPNGVQGVSNYMILNNSTLWMTNNSSSSSIYVAGANGGMGNYMIMSNGSTASAYALAVGSNTGATNNYVIIDHSTLNLTNALTAIGIGNGGSAIGNYMVMNCATVNTYSGLVNIGGLANNTLFITGGSVLTNAELEIGTTPGGNNVSATFNNSTFSDTNANGVIYVSYATGTNNYLIVTNNSAVTAYSLVIGNVGGSTNCYATFSNATLTVKSASSSAIALAPPAGATSNSLNFYNTTIYDVGGIVINSTSGNNNGGTNNVMTFNNSMAYLGGGMTFGYATSVGTPSNSLGNNGMVITNGSYIGTTNTSCAVSMKGSGNYLLVAGTNSTGRQSILDLGIANAGTLTLAYPATGCWIRVDAGGVISNVCGASAIGLSGAGGNIPWNPTLIITNGGRVIGGPVGACYGWNIGGGGSGVAGAINAGMIVSGPGSVFDWSTNENTSAGYPCLGVPSLRGWGTNGYLTINNGGLLKLDLNTQAVVAVGSQPNALSNSVGNTITIASGGTLEAISYVATNAVAGNTITNFGGIYQFASPNNAPVLTSSGNGVGIYLNSGTISYRSTSNADVNCNQPGKPLDSAAKMTFVAGGSNIFRLNWATNQVATHQTYVFDAGFGPTNFYRLEMVTAGIPGTIPTVGGSTCYRGMSGDSLTIGTNVMSGINSSSYMLCSNTTALVSLTFTNNGTLSIENSTLTFGTNATLNGALVIDMNNLTSGQAAGTTPVIQASNLTIGASSTLTLLNATTSTNLTLIAYTGTLNSGAKFSLPVVGLPQNTIISYSSGKIALAPAAAGSTLIFW